MSIKQKSCFTCKWADWLETNAHCDNCKRYNNWERRGRPMKIQPIYIGHRNESSSE